MRRQWKLTLLLAFAVGIRLLAQIPLVIDDDEAWFSSSAAALRASGGPLAFYSRAIDNKPPGTAWFYWLVQKLTGCGNDPRMARLAYLGVLILTAWLLTKYVRRIASESAGLAAALFLLAGAAVTPKLLAVTNEGLMLPWIVGAFVLMAAQTTPKRIAGAGLCLGIATLIKQTALVFALPLALAISPGAYFGLGCGLLVPLALAIPALGVHDFWYWTWTYPTQVLPQARGALFSGWSDLGQNTVLFSLALLPLVWAAGRKLLSERFREKATRVTVLWGLAAAIAVVAGKGLFPHYFLLGLPPLCALAALSLRKRRAAVLTLGTLALCNCILAALPGSGVFWGTDLPYHERLGVRIRELTPLEEPVLIWGGSSLPLSAANRRSATSFVNARYLMPPYATDESIRRFQGEFDQEKPAVVVDVHERGDNQFNYPMQMNAWLNARILQDYEPWVDPALPWAVFYVRKDRLVRVSALVKKTEATSAAPLDLIRTTWSAWEKLPPGLGPELVSRLGVRLYVDLDPFLRSWYALHDYCGATNCAQDAQAKGLLTRLEADARRWTAQWEAAPAVLPESVFVPEGYAYGLETEHLFAARGFSSPFALAAPLWWPSFAVVQLQPVALPRVR